MFQLEGTRTDVGRIAQSLLDNSGLFGDPEENYASSQMTCVIYREDPVHHYLFLTAHAGLRQPEPMYGPIVDDDQRQQQTRDQHRDPTKANMLGFVQREGIKWSKPYPGKYWTIWLSGRSDSEDPKAFEKKLYPTLKTLLDAFADEKPLFPELWRHERLARERLHDVFRYLKPGASLDRVCTNLTTQLNFAINNPQGECLVGIYLDTDSQWTLVGTPGLDGRLPGVIRDGYELARLPTDKLDQRSAEALNAFGWVHWSTRPVLWLRNESSAVWTDRIAQCGYGFAPEVTGICLVPLIDLNCPWRSKGVIMLASTKSPEWLRPAHVFLLSRVARDVSGFITPLLPLPGFPWWPDVGLSRGTKVKVQWPHGQEPVPGIAEIVSDLMPSDSSVAIRPLQPGHSGASIFHLSVTDHKHHIEIPRVLKIGDEASIAKELRAYYRYVHNKRLGVAARVETAQFRAARSTDASRGLIVYTLVGSGDKALPWSEWSTKADWEGILAGLDILRNQLWFWYSTRRGVDRPAVDLLIREPFFAAEPLKEHLKNLKDPTLAQVIEELRRLLEPRDRSGGTSTCVVHGDLHCRNIFSILSSDGTRRPTDVALIDWGCVADGRHPLSDISRLMADLMYKVRWPATFTGTSRTWWEKERNKALQQVRAWAPEPSNSNDWCLAMIHQVAKMLFYHSDTDENETYLKPEARRQAWTDLQGWVKTCIGKPRKKK